MKEKIQAALSAEYKGLGLSEKTIGRLADYIVTKGSVTKEEEIDAAVKGDDVKLLATSIQGEVAGLKRAKETAENALADYKATHPDKDPNNPGKDPENDDPGKLDIAKIVADGIAAGLKPLKDEIDALKSANSTKAALETAHSTFFSGDYAKKYVPEAEEAWDRAVELNEATGNKMTAQELAEKASAYFNKAVSRKGVDTTKPFQADPADSEDTKGTTDWSGEVKRLQGKGKIPKTTDKV